MARVKTLGISEETRKLGSQEETFLVSYLPGFLRKTSDDTRSLVTA
jgi:hypothetical protein